MRTRTPKRWVAGAALAIAAGCVPACSFLVDFPDLVGDGGGGGQACEPMSRETCSADATDTASACGSGERVCAADGSAFGPCACAAVAWSDSFGSATGTARGTSVAVAPDGSVVVAGLFTGSINLGGATLSSTGAGDLFLAKFSATGTHLWSKSFGDAGDQSIPPVVAVDSTGAVIFAGGFTGTLGLGGADLMAANTYGNPFVAKFDPDGNHVWSHGYGERGAVTSVAIGKDDSIALGGIYQDTLSFGPNAMLFPSTGTYQPFIARLDATSAGIWAIAEDTDPYEDTATLVRVGPSDETIVAGIFNGDFTASGPIMFSASSPEVYVVRYSYDAPNADVNVDWYKTFDGSGTQSLAGIAVDSSGDVVVAGHYKGSLQATPQPMLQNSDSTEDFYLVKLGSSNGDAAFAKALTETGATLPASVTVDGSNAITVAGSMNGEVDFGGGPIHLAPGATDAAFLTKYDPSGAHLWSKALGAADALLSVADIAADHTSGDLCVTGNLVGTIDVGNGMLSGTDDLFVARFAP